MAVERFPVDEGTIVMFAHSIGDTNPIYSDPAYAATTEVGGIIAPPTYVQTSSHFDPDYPLRPKPGQAWFGSGRTPTGREPASGEGGGQRQGAGLHAEQHYEYHRPIRAGETLTLSVHPGKTWEKEGRRGGTLHFQESITEYRGADEELVVVARAVGVRTSKTVEG